jgi:hypothetical protein
MTQIADNFVYRQIDGSTSSITNHEILFRNRNKHSRQYISGKAERHIQAPGYSSVYGAPSTRHSEQPPLRVHYSSQKS